MTQDVIQKLKGNTKAMEIFTHCGTLMKEADAKKSDKEGVPLPDAKVTAAAASALKWAKDKDGKWVGGKEIPSRTLFKFWL